MRQQWFQWPHFKLMQKKLCADAEFKVGRQRCCHPHLGCGSPSLVYITHVAHVRASKQILPKAPFPNSREAYAWHRKGTCMPAPQASVYKHPAVNSTISCQLFSLGFGRQVSQFRIMQNCFNWQFAPTGIKNKSKNKVCHTASKIWYTPFVCI